jgi:uncharacterized membrane protein YvbJ
MKCPQCNVSIEEGQTYCGNCKTKINWRNGQPRKDLAQQFNRAGDSMIRAGLGMTLVVIVIVLLFVAC